MALELPAHTAASLYRRDARGLGLDESEWSGSRRRRHARGASGTPAPQTLSHPQLQRLQGHVLHAVAAGLRWLVALQNRDGGWPTFCRGWGKLPFDRSGTDLTAHALRAMHAWVPQWERLHQANAAVPKLRQLQAAKRRGLRFLARSQREDGSWIPLWFGNQDRAQEDNPVYGTGKVLLAYAALGYQSSPQAMRGHAQAAAPAECGWRLGGGRRSWLSHAEFQPANLGSRLPPK